MENLTDKDFEIIGRFAAREYFCLLAQSKNVEAEEFFNSFSKVIGEVYMMKYCDEVMKEIRKLQKLGLIN